METIVSAKKEAFQRCLWLFFINVFISAFTFGGGYTVIPMVRKYFVQKKAFFTEEELMDMSAIAQSTPGAIAVNLSVLAGYRTAGMAGAVISCAAAVLPPLLLLSALSVCYAQFCENLAVRAVLRGMEAGVAALIVDLVVDMAAILLREKSAFLSLLAACSFAAVFFLQADVILVLAVCCLLTLLRVCQERRREKRLSEKEAVL